MILTSRMSASLWAFTFSNVFFVKIALLTPQSKNGAYIMKMHSPLGIFCDYYRFSLHSISVCKNLYGLCFYLPI